MGSHGNAHGNDMVVNSTAMRAHDISWGLHVCVLTKFEGAIMALPLSYYDTPVTGTGICP